jgi:hypothetical protein
VVTLAPEQLYRDHYLKTIQSQAVFEILYCLEQIHQLMLTVWEEFEKNPGATGSGRANDRFITAESENVCFLLAHLYVTAIKSSCSKPKPKPKPNQKPSDWDNMCRYIRTATLQIIGECAKHTSDLDESVRIRLALRMLHHPGPLAFRVGEEEEEEEGHEEEQEGVKALDKKPSPQATNKKEFDALTREMVTSWMQGYCRDPTGTHIIMSQYRSAVEEVMSAKHTKLNESAFYFMTHYVFCELDWGQRASPNGKSHHSSFLLSLHDWFVKHVTEEIASTGLGSAELEPWIELCLCANQLAVFLGRVPSGIIVKALHDRLTTNIGKMNLFDRFHDHMNLAKHNPYEPLIHRAQHKVRDHRHVSYHTHFLVAMAWAQMADLS